MFAGAQKGEEAGQETQTSAPQNKTVATVPHMQNIASMGHFIPTHLPKEKITPIHSYSTVGLSPSPPSFLGKELSTCVDLNW